MNFINWILGNWQLVLAALNAVLVAAIAIAVMIPGDAPEKQLQAIVDFIAKISKK